MQIFVEIGSVVFAFIADKVFGYRFINIDLEAEREEHCLVMICFNSQKRDMFVACAINTSLSLKERFCFHKCYLVTRDERRNRVV